MQASIVMRSSGERTEQLLEYILNQQVGSDVVRKIKESPHSRMVQRSFELGLEMGRPWTICVDADMVLAIDSINEIINKISNQESKPFIFGCPTYDKFFGGPTGGFGVYRTSLLKDALNYVPLDKPALRSESYVVEQMKKEGHEVVNFNKIFGVHEFYQSYHDIFAKKCFRGHKGQSELPFLLRRCAKQGFEDRDFWVATWAIIDSFKDNVDLTDYDFSYFYRRAENFMNFMDIDEKEPLDTSQFNPFTVKEINCWEVSEEYQELKIHEKQGINNSRINRIMEKIKDIGFLRTASWILGKGLKRSSRFFLSKSGALDSTNKSSLFRNFKT